MLAHDAAFARFWIPASAGMTTLFDGAQGAGFVLAHDAAFVRFCIPASAGMTTLFDGAQDAGSCSS